MPASPAAAPHQIADQQRAAAVCQGKDGERAQIRDTEIAQEVFGYERREQHKGQRWRQTPQHACRPDLL